MVDAYLMIRPWNRRTETARVAGKGETAPESNHIGDIIEVRRANASPWSTATERTMFYFLRVNGIPQSVAEKVRDRLLSFAGDRPRGFGLGGADVTPAKALAWLKAQFPGASSNFDAYFNGDTEQPEAAVLSISWDNLKTRVWDKLKARLATAAEMEA